MDFSYTNEQTMLRDSAESFARKRYGFEQHLKTLELPGHFDPEAWQEMADLGWLALPIPEWSDGLDGSGLDLSIVCEAMGAGMQPEPYISGVILPTKVIIAGASHDQIPGLVAPLSSGQQQMAVAWAEQARAQNPAHCKTQANENAEGWVLNGKKLNVLNAPNADVLIVSARTAGTDTSESGISIFVVDAKAEGVTRSDYQIMGGGCASDIRFDNVKVAHDALLGEAHEAFNALQIGLDYAAMCACSHALGGMRELLSRTIEYLKVRKQFGQAIGNFQALQHRAVDMFIELEQSRSMVIMASVKVDSQNPQERARAISATKIYLAKAATFIAQQAVQLHGGIGVTEELDVGHYFRQLTSFCLLHGDTESQFRRYESLDSNND